MMNAQLLNKRCKVKRVKTKKLKLKKHAKLRCTVRKRKLRCCRKKVSLKRPRRVQKIVCIKTKVVRPKVHVAAPNVNVASPLVNVAAPNVSVAPPEVNVAAPNVNVEAPNVSVFPKIKVEVEDSQEECLDDLRKQLLQAKAKKIQIEVITAAVPGGGGQPPNRIGTVEKVEDGIFILQPNEGPPNREIVYSICQVIGFIRYARVEDMAEAEPAETNIAV